MTDGVRRTLLSARLLDLAGLADADQSVVGLELLHGLGGVVDEGEAGGLSTTELGAEAEDVDLVLGGLVEGAELLTELILGDVGAAGVEDVTVRERSARENSHAEKENFPQKSKLPPVRPTRPRPLSDLAPPESRVFMCRDSVCVLTMRRRFVMSLRGLSLLPFPGLWASGGKRRQKEDLRGKLTRPSAYGQAGGYG